MRMLGLRPTNVRGLREYVQVVRSLLQGEEVMYAHGGEPHPVRFTSTAQGHVRLDPPPPVLIAANGPLGQAAAGELADGVCTSLPRGGTMPQVMARVASGAKQAGRVLPNDFHTAALVNLLVLQPGESVTSPRVLSEVGPAIMTNFHYLVDWVRETGNEAPAFVRPVWDDYVAFRQARAAADSHLTMHASHYAVLDPEEAQFITPDIVRALCIVGEPDEVIERLRNLENAGLKQITFHPPFERRYQAMEEFARLVIARMQ